MTTTPQQSGSVTAGHLAVWTADGVLQDSGGTSTPTLTLLPLINSGTWLSALNAPASGSYSQYTETFTSSTLIEDLEPHGGASALVMARMVNGNTITTWNTVTFQVNNGFIKSGRSIAAATNTTLTASDYCLVMNTSSAAVTVTLLQNPETWREYTVFDGSGNANTHNIIVSSGASGVNINGSTLATISSAYGATSYTFNGTNWMGK